MIGEHTGKPAAFASLRNGGSMQFRLDHPIAHLIQYWHGQCSIRMKWSDVFDYISTQLMGAYSCALKNAEESVPILGGFASATREYEFYEPHFSSRARFMEWGFAFHGKLRTHSAGIPTATVDMNPAFVLSRNTSTGKINIRDVQHKVMVVNDTSQHDIQRLIEDNIAKATRDLNSRFASMKMNIAADCSTTGACSNGSSSKIAIVKWWKSRTTARNCFCACDRRQIRQRRHPHHASGGLCLPASLILICDPWLTYRPYLLCSASPAAGALRIRGHGPRPMREVPLHLLATRRLAVATRAEIIGVTGPGIWANTIPIAGSTVSSKIWRVSTAIEPSEGIITKPTG